MASSGGGKGRKHGRNRKRCERYKAENRRVKNKARKIAKRIRNYKEPKNTLKGMNKELAQAVRAIL